ncbi:flavin reductase family protein [Pontibaca salina]|uniref:flavin reductase family protein n=1 Tax=Pontibaca salina TaxID=2795731 RepID=UPI002FCD9429
MISEDTFIPRLESQTAYREALGCFGTGVTVVTHMTDTGPLAMTANSFASVSLDPALVLWCAAHRSARHALFAKARNYVIHIMDESQLPLARHFSRTGHDFTDIEWSKNPEGQPVLADSLARFECELEAVYPGGDHSIILGKVVRFAVRPGSGLIFKRGQYGGFSDLF